MYRDGARKLVDAFSSKPRSFGTMLGKYDRVRSKRRIVL